MIGMKGAAGVAVTYGLVELFLRARSVLILIGLAFFIAAGLDPVVVWLTRHGLRRWMAVTLVVFALFAFVGGFIAAAIPPHVPMTRHSETAYSPHCRASVASAQPSQ